MPAETAPEPRLTLHSLEALRGIAAIQVVLLHSPFFSARAPSRLVANSAIFVDLFFVISGLVMALAYQRSIGESVHFRRFALRRIGRLYPLHLFALALWVPYVLLKARLRVAGVEAVDALATDTAWSLLTNLFLVHSFGLHDALSWNPPSWSISVELYVYFVFFAVVWALPSHRRDRVLPWLASGLAMAAFIALALAPPAGSTILRTYDYGILRGLGGFFTGVALLSLRRAPLLTRWPAALSSVVEVSVVVMSALLVARSHTSNAVRFATIGAFAVVVLVFSLDGRGVLSRVFRTAPFQAIGRLSYSIYLLHALIFAVTRNLLEHGFDVATRAIEFEGGLFSSRAIVSRWGDLWNVAAVGIVLAVASLTYRYVERPWRDRFRAWADAGEVTPARGR